MSAEPAYPPRSMAARSAARASAIARSRRAQPNGIWGMALFLCSEVTLFGTLIATYFYLDFNSPRWPPPGIERPTIIWPAIATGWLVATSVPMWLASRRARAGDRPAVLWTIALAMVMQGLYFAAQVILFEHDIRKFSPKGSSYGSIYFTLLGAHHGHVFLGLLLDVALLWFLATRGLTNYWLTGVRALSIYWHVVNALAVLVLLTQLSPSL